jgi:hypothetical protein
VLGLRRVKLHAAVHDAVLGAACERDGKCTAEGAGGKSWEIKSQLLNMA